MIKGFIDRFDGKHITGWAFDDSNPMASLDIFLHIDDEYIAKTTTSILRKKLAENNIHPTGICGFAFRENLPGISDSSNIKIYAGNVKFKLDFAPSLTKRIINSNPECFRCLVVGINKSGTSILTYKIAQGLSIDQIYFEPGGRKSLSDIAIHRSFTVNQNYITKSLFYPTQSVIHLEPISELYTHKIWIIRDPRDVIISAFLYTWNFSHDKPEKLFQQALKLTREKESNPDGIPFYRLMSTITGIIPFVENNFGKLSETLRSLDKSWCIFKYEDMVDNRLEKLESYLGSRINSNSELPGELSRVVRSKTYGNWRKWFTVEDVALLKPILSPILKDLGYDANDWDIHNGSELDPIEGSEYMLKIHNVKRTTIDPSAFYPPANMLKYGSLESFIDIGDRYFKLFKSIGIKPSDHILEIGCGAGRIARNFANYLDSGTYTGVDIVPEFIRWCKQTYEPYHHMNFIHLDIQNHYYRQEDGIQADQVRLPFENESFDFIYLTSVFSHMYAESVRNYLSEIMRILKSGKKCLATFFILDEDSEKMMLEGRTKRNFTSLDGNTYVYNENNPEAAVAFKKTFLLNTYQKCGFEITLVQNGLWRDSITVPPPHTIHFNQDYIVALKAIK